MRTLEDLIGLVVGGDMAIQSPQVFIGSTAYFTSDSWVLGIAVSRQVEE